MDTITTASDERTNSDDGSAHMSTKKKSFFSRKSTLDSRPTVDHSESRTEKKATARQRHTSRQASQQLSGQLSHLNESGDKFDGDGVQFGAKLIGHEFVAEARGEHMCQQSLKKLKILQRGLGGHKRRVLIFISYDGIKIRDSTTSELVYHHSVPQISFISRDETDPRAFGYVFGSSTTGHQFIALKTQKEAMPIMSAIGQLFAATLMRKKSETIDYNSEHKVESKDETKDTKESKEEKVRRESSITLRPSRSDSPNVPSMPAPPPPTNATHLGLENDFFASFESMTTDFENDWKVNKEQLDQISNSCDVITTDPFASSIGSLSLSSGDWANFDDDNVSTSASPLQRSHNSFANSGALVLGSPKPKNDVVSSFNSSSSIALNELFASGHHSGSFNQNSFSNANMTNNSNVMTNFGNFNSEAVKIPQRISPNNTQQIKNNQSVSSTSSTDRYACFAEIHSQSSSIFDSLCDQIAEDVETSSAQLADHVSASKSLNSSLNGGFGYQHQFSSSYNGNFFSFTNPLNNMNYNQSSAAPNTVTTINENGTGIWANNSNTSSSVSPSEKSFGNSQWSSTSSPPVSVSNLFANRINENIAEKPVFAELDPLGKDKPFVDKSQFFAEQKFKPTLKDLNSDSIFNDNDAFASVADNDGINSMAVSSSWKYVSANPFSNNNGSVFRQESGDSERISPNPKPLNPFSTCDPQPVRSTPTPPLPPPRPPSRECPPVPPRTDLPNAGHSAAPPLPRRRISLEKQIQEQRWYNIQNQLHNDTPTTYESPPPPIPNPQRRSSNSRKAVNWDPFNCAFVDTQLSSMTSNKIGALRNCDNENVVSTPKDSAKCVPPLRQSLKLSEINSPNNCWSSVSDETTTSVFGDNFSSQRTNTTNSTHNVGKSKDNNDDDSDKANHISPPERNIFITKADPFEDEFFAN